MRIDPKCPVCERFDEDGGHLFFKCKTVRHVWNQLQLETERAMLASMDSVRSVMEYIFQTQEEKRVTMIFILWAWWSERNNIREGGRRRMASGIAQSIRLHVAESLNKQTTMIAGVPRRKGKWSKPPAGKLKLNCDASFIPSAAMGTWGFVIRESDGDVVSAGRGKVEHLLGAFQAKLISCLQGVQEATRLGIGNLVLETDALQVRQALCSDEFDASVVGGLIAELKFLVNVNFISFQCAYVPRECNRVAHELAASGYACAEGEEQILGSLSDHINVFVADDLSVHE
ncbi:uncharacterized protein [Miscanthus floridulus]|uniref:uncharacterized protein n=1 Tax=Miscanthus floridulus TaxID=154761 RepID=UPI00345B3136